MVFLSKESIRKCLTFVSFFANLVQIYYDISGQFLSLTSAIDSEA